MLSTHKLFSWEFIAAVNKLFTQHAAAYFFHSTHPHIFSPTSPAHNLLSCQDNLNKNNFAPFNDLCMTAWRLNDLNKRKKKNGEKKYCEHVSLISTSIFHTIGARRWLCDTTTMMITTTTLWLSMRTQAQVKESKIRTQGKQQLFIECTGSLALILFR